MNRIKVLLAIMAAASMIISCESADLDTNQPVEEQLAVTTNNLKGNWELVLWNGSAMDLTYMYLTIDRGLTYTMYQNPDSFSDVPRVITGEYFLYEEDLVGVIIRGNYEYTGDEWSRRYIVKSLTASSMVWVDMNDSSEIMEFKKIDAIPVAK